MDKKNSLEESLRKSKKAADKSRKVVLAAFGAIFVLLIISICSIKNKPVSLIAALLAIGILVILVIAGLSTISFTGGPRGETIRDAQKGPNAIRQIDNKTVYIGKRLEGNYGSFTVEPMKITLESYSPERYVYTGATVGGITTGGITKIGGIKYHTKESRKEFCLVYHKKIKDISGDEISIGNEISIINLPASLAQEAMHDPVICKMIDGNTIKSEYLSKRDCYLLLQWLSGMGTDTVI